MLHLTEIITPSCIKIPLLADTKQGIIEELIDLLCDDGHITDRTDALNAVLLREKTRTTAIGNELAIPHGKTDAANKLVMAMGISNQPVDFESIDDKPVKLVILLLSPHEMTGPHIQALATISRIMSFETIRKKMINAQTPQEIIELIQKAELKTAD